MAQAAIGIAVRFETIECGGCGMLFAVPAGFHRDCLEEGRPFRCPNPKCSWPSQSYTKSEVQRLKSELEKEKRRAEHAVEARRWAEQQRERAERQRSAARGQVTRLKNRAAAGVCPSCTQTFQNLKSHMETKHPGFVAAPEAS